MNIKRLFLPSAVVLALGLGLAVAQNITKGLQVSQDPTGAFGVDSSNNVYFPAHQLNNAQASPTKHSCGTASLSQLYGTDQSGVVVEGGTGTGCGVAFSQAYSTPPACVVMYNSIATPTAFSATAGGFVTTHSSTSNLSFSYWCGGRP